MKLFIKLSVLALIFSSLFGCASSEYTFISNLEPPESFNPVFLRYKALPEEKVLVVAVDPGGRWSFGYDHSRETLEEAAERAAKKCDKARQDHKVFTKGTIFAINDDIVYNDM